MATQITQEKQINKLNTLKNKYLGQKRFFFTITDVVYSPKQKEYKFECKCICGNKRVIRQWTLLKSENNKSCGCKFKELKQRFILADDKAAFNKIFRGYKISADSRNLDFNLSFDEFKKIVKSNCFYCNVEPKQVSKSKSSSITYNGIDRVDNEKGYTSSNVVACCGFCNVAKNNLSIEEFKMKIEKIYKNLGSK